MTKQHVKGFSIFKSLLLLGLSSNFLFAKTIDFSVDEDGTPFVNGQSIASPDEFGIDVSVSTNVGNLGAAIFDTDPTGPNQGSVGQDDLLVGLGNALIIQHQNYPTQTTPGIFDQPVDATTGGIFNFDFTNASTMISIDFIDLDGNAGANVLMTDTNGLSRNYSIPDQWTNDVREMPNGYATLDLTTLADQAGETANLATASEDAGFDASSVTRLEVTLFGSGAIDNLVYVPEPGSQEMVAILLLVFAWAVRRR